MALNIEQENQRHQAGWQGFTKFVTYSSVSIAVVLILMALFLV